MKDTNSFEFVVSTTVNLGAVTPGTWAIDCCKPDQSIGSKDKDRVHMSVTQPAIVIHILFQQMRALLQTSSSGPNTLLSKQWVLGFNCIDAVIDFLCGGKLTLASGWC